MTLYEDLTAGRRNLTPYAENPVLSRGVREVLDEYWHHSTREDARALDALIADGDASLSQYHAVRRGAAIGAVASVGALAGIMYLPEFRASPGEIAAYLTAGAVIAGTVFWQLARVQCQYVINRLSQRAGSIDGLFGRNS